MIFYCVFYIKFSENVTAEWRCCDFRTHDDVIKWKHFRRYWTFVWGIHRSPVNSSHTGQWRGALMFSLIFLCLNKRLSKPSCGWWVETASNSLQCQVVVYFHNFILSIFQGWALTLRILLLFMHYFSFWHKLISNAWHIWTIVHYIPISMLAHAHISNGRPTFSKLQLALLGYSNGILETETWLR